MSDLTADDLVILVKLVNVASTNLDEAADLSLVIRRRDLTAKGRGGTPDIYSERGVVHVNQAAKKINELRDKLVGMLREKWS